MEKKLLDNDWNIEYIVEEMYRIQCSSMFHALIPFQFSLPFNGISERNIWTESEFQICFSILVVPSLSAPFYSFPSNINNDCFSHSAFHSALKLLLLLLLLLLFLVIFLLLCIFILSLSFRYKSGFFFFFFCLRVQFMCFHSISPSSQSVTGD